MPTRNPVQKIHVVLGFHVNYNHSYRGDRNDASGFGYDTRIIRSIVDTLDKANARGLDARGTWDFDNFWSVQNCMTKYARGLLDAIARRVRARTDEAIIDNWNNGLMSCMTREELRLSVQRAISNEWGSGVLNLFGNYSPVVRPQEMMFTHGNIEALAEQGIKAVSLYYSAIPFDSIRNFVPRLSPNERYNPLRLKSPVSDKEILVIPTYNQGDVLDNVSLEYWLKKIRKQQQRGDIPGNALLYINMDADAPLWTGVKLPKPFSKLPNMRGLEEYIEVVNALAYAQFSSLGEYLNSNSPAGEISIDMDTADGSHTGYNSWAEKWINYPLWTLHQRSRRLERLANGLLRGEGATGDEAARARGLLYGPGLSNIECRILTASTTHFGLAVPMINPERLRVAFHYADEGYKKAQSALEDLVKAAAAAGAGEAGCPPPVAVERRGAGRAKLGKSGGWEDAKNAENMEENEVEFVVVRHNKYDNCPPNTPITPVSVVLDVPEEFLEKPLKLRLFGPDGNEATFDIIDKSVANATNATMLRFSKNPSKSGLELAKNIEKYIFRKIQVSTTPGFVKADKSILSNGLITARIDQNGHVFSLIHQGREFSAQSLFSPGITYRVNGRDTWFGPQKLTVDAESEGLRGKCGRHAAVRLDYSFNLKGVKLIGNSPQPNGYIILSVFEDSPCLFVFGVMNLPETPCGKDNIGIGHSVSTRFDPDWQEVMPLHISPGISNLPGRKLKIWKHNYLDVTHGYELNFGDIDPANRDVDSLNNHVTDGWLAFGNGEAGLLVAHDQTVNTSPAMCPIRLRESDGAQTVTMNPFGTYCGRQLSHLPDGSGAARDFMIAAIPGMKSTAPSYNGKSIVFNMMLAPYIGDVPPEKARLAAEDFSMPAAGFVIKDDRVKRLKGIEDFYHGEPEFDYRKEYSLDKTAGWTYDDFLRDASSRPAPRTAEKPGLSNIPKLPIRAVGGFATDVIKSLLPK